MRIIAILLLATLGACSFGISEPHLPASLAERCDPGSTLPDIDTIAGLTLLGVAGAAFASDATTPEHSELRGLASIGVGLPALLVGGVYLVGASRGFEKTHRCRDALNHAAELRAAKAGEELADPAAIKLAIVRDAMLPARMGDCLAVDRYIERLRTLAPAADVPTALEPCRLRAADPARDRCVHEVVTGFAAAARLADRARLDALSRLPTCSSADAWTSIVAAAIAATRGDCSQVVALDITVHRTAVDLWDLVFRHDPAISRCLAEL